MFLSSVPGNWNPYFSRNCSGSRVKAAGISYIIDNDYLEVVKDGERGDKLPEEGH